MKVLRKIVMVGVIVLALSTMIYGVVSSSGRRIKQGSTMPEFSTVDITGKLFTYNRSHNSALMLVFLSPQQKRSQKAVEDILNVLAVIPGDKIGLLKVAFVMQNIDNKNFYGVLRDPLFKLKVISKMT